MSILPFFAYHKAYWVVLMLALSSLARAALLTSILRGETSVQEPQVH